MTSDAKSPYGQRLLPSVLDELAQTNPSRLYGAIPKTADVGQGFYDVTMADMARCVNFMANWISDRFGQSDRFETFTYIGVSDFRGIIVFLAAVKCGYKLLLPSPRNPPSINISLMSQTESTKLLYTVEVAPIVNQLQNEYAALITQTIPSFDEMMKSSPEHFPYKKTFSDARDDPVVVLHSSGSTGMPTPITMTHGTFATVDNVTNLPLPPGRERRDASMFKFDGEARVYLLFPFFHLGGFIYFTVNAIFFNVSLVLGPPHMILDGPLLKSISQQQKLRAMILVPSIMEQLLQEPNGLDIFKGLDFVAYSGAPSSPAIGDSLSKVVKFVSPFGSTEIVTIPELELPREDWEWHEFNPNFRHELQDYDSVEGLTICELVLLVDESMMDHMGVYHNLPGVTEYHTKDLFIRHPERPTLYKYYGRKDDIIVLANGEKFNPIPLEMDIQGHPSLKGALVIGNGRVQPALIVEPKEPPDATDQLLEDLWPSIEKSNSLVPGQGRIHYGRVICARPEKPFTRTAKGTVVRKLTEKAYTDEIEKLYSASLVQGTLPSTGLKPVLKQVYERSTVVDFLRGVLATSFAQAATLGEDEDFYAHGLDSVQTLEITSSLKRNLRSQLPESQASDAVAWISARTIYRNPTLASLSRLLTAFLNDSIVPEDDHRLATARLFEEVVAQYTEKLPKKSISQAAPPRPTSKVAVVGSTGYLGLYILGQLLTNPTVSHIYCLNRSVDAQQKQVVALRAIDPSLDSQLHKLVYMVVSLGEPLLGLSKNDYDLIAREVDVIVYNSWRLDFGLSLKSFDPFLRATRDLIELSAGSSRNMRIVFISSISSVAGIAGTTVPEVPMEDPSAAIDIGYAQSKLAAERILAAANRQSGIPVTVARVCQIGGPAHGGAWPEQPWISALLRTAKTLKCIPSDLPPIDWVPVDNVAVMLNAFILHPAQETAQVFNVYPAKGRSWEVVVKFLDKSFGVSRTVPLREWIQMLRNIQDPTAEDVNKMPALKILDYFETFDNGSSPSGFSTSHATAVSGVEIPMVDERMLERWLGTWDLK
ncbi:acetyl-CoA synthetase-like protein [Hypomontagnella monticulosa]|nr:acetyl-CoA synthetase-like protein [Hypomontagnella monticulosa]